MIDADELNLSREVFRPVQLFQSERPHQYLPRVCAAAEQSVHYKKIGKGVHKELFGMFACEFLGKPTEGGRENAWETPGKEEGRWRFFWIRERGGEKVAE